MVECPAGYEPLESIVRSISTTEAPFELKNCSDDCVPLVMGDSCVFSALDLYQVVKAKSRSVCPDLQKTKWFNMIESRQFQYLRNLFFLYTSITW
ncbi:uncharacterized protein LOC124848526 isoform X2 [Vigna umbellata]|uniref:uncharacterized protein LOC124848526 isoform X2 n=1 Tax=Vigna umbellata TaxID=87088 RepID=UPI001F5F369A|nr:uncharacterized protein LOC124848526 isoform X2 [Vigna umbellata]